jgi:hypothetical protein
MTETIRVRNPGGSISYVPAWVIRKAWIAGLTWHADACRDLGTEGAETRYGRLLKCLEEKEP